VRTGPARALSNAARDEQHKTSSGAGSAGGYPANRGIHAPARELLKREMTGALAGQGS
jgi:hypothetical protein